jgi:LmbE family N-acetylglucosaminyl deacetylase
MRFRAALCAAAAAVTAASSGWAQTPSVPKGSAEILQELMAFRETGSVLYVAAHPDDEDSQLIAYFARGAKYRTAYLSINRGDGGQNLIGPEFGDELGVIRTQELLAARRVDGARQYFTLARDFGYSKDVRDTLRRWDRKEVLADVVRVIREFRPDAIVTRFSPVAGHTHGHHTASAVLAVEAFKVAGDPNALKDEVGELAPWKPKRVLWDIGRFGGGPEPENALRLDVGGFDPILGESYGEIAARSRSNHRTQGYGSVGSRGSRYAYFRLLAGEPARDGPLDGVDTTWGRYPGGDEIARLVDAAVLGFDPKDPSRSVPALLEIRERLSGLRGAPGEPADPAILAKKAQLDRIIQGCLGLYVDTAVASADAVPGERLALRQTAIVRCDVPVIWRGAVINGRGEKDQALELKENRAQSRQFELTVPADEDVSQPYWLKVPETPGMFRVRPQDRWLIGQAENPPAIAIDAVFEIGGQMLTVAANPEQITADPATGEVHRPLHIIPPVSLSFAEKVQLFAPGQTRVVTLEATAARSNVTGVLRLSHPPAQPHGNDFFRPGTQPARPSGPAPVWQVAPGEIPFKIMSAGQRMRVSFNVTAPADSEVGNLVGEAEVGGRTYDNARVEIRYEHIPTQLLQPEAALRAVSLNVAVKARRVGYLPGAGDDIPAALEQLGCDVVPLTGADLTATALQGLDAVVIGIRAFNVRTDLASHLDGLFAYVAAGGTVVEQYNTPNALKTSRLGPYPLELDRDLPAYRVTDENAAVTLLVPSHPAFTTPNRIEPGDFAGWVQERGLNFPSEWDPHYTALLSCHDVGEAPLTSGLLVARYGKGWYVVTGLSFFRQLPVGVPGAYRLFANLVSLGK